MDNLNKKFPNIPQSWALVAIFFALSLVLSSFLVTAKFIFKNLSSTTEGWITTVIFALSFTLTFLAVKLISKGYSFKENIKFKSAPPYIYILLLLIIPALGMIMDVLMSYIPMPEIVEKMFKDAFKLNIPTFISAVILAPILEEVLCRGVILQGLLKNTSPIKAIAYSALMFAVLHLNPWQGIPAFILGVVMAWLCWRTKSILPAIFIHFVNNAFSFAIMWLFGQDADMSEILGDKYPWIIIASLTIVITLGYYLYQKVENEFSNRESDYQS